MPISKKKERHTWEINRKSIFSFFSKNLDWLTDAETLKSVVLDSFEQLNLAESATSEISLQVTVHGNGTDAFVFCFLALNTSCQSDGCLALLTFIWDGRTKYVYVIFRGRFEVSKMRKV